MTLIGDSVEIIARNNRKISRYGTVVELKGIFVALAILYRAAVIYIGPTPALLTPAISKQ